MGRSNHGSKESLSQWTSKVTSSLHELIVAAKKVLVFSLNEWVFLKLSACGCGQMVKTGVSECTKATFLVLVPVGLLINTFILFLMAKQKRIKKRRVPIKCKADDGFTVILADD